MDDFANHCSRFAGFASGDDVTWSSPYGEYPAKVAAVVMFNGYGLIGPGIDIVTEDSGRVRVQPESLTKMTPAKPVEQVPCAKNLTRHSSLPHSR